MYQNYKKYVESYSQFYLFKKNQTQALFSEKRTDFRRNFCIDNLETG